MEQAAPKWLNPQRLIDLLIEQRDLYKRLRSLSERQRGMISSDTPEHLLNILRERQALITALAAINEKLSPFRQGWDGLYAQLPDTARQQVSDLLDEINGLLGAILAADQEDSALLGARRQTVGEALRSVNDTRAANAAYARNAGAGRTTPAGGQGA